MSLPTAGLQLYRALLGLPTALHESLTGKPGTGQNRPVTPLDNPNKRVPEWRLVHENTTTHKRRVSRYIDYESPRASSLAAQL